jgi:hypothetical protein
VKSGRSQLVHQLPHVANLSRARKSAGQINFCGPNTWKVGVVIARGKWAGAEWVVGMETVRK